MLEHADKIQSLVQALIAIGGAMGSMMVFWWKVSQAFARQKVEHDGLKEQLAKLAKHAGKVSENLVILATKLDEREKDITKVEGAIEMQRRDMMHVVASLQQATSSMDAMWRTLQTMFPDRVPKRASDRTVG